MNENTIIKSEKAKNYFIPIAICLFLLGFLSGLIFQFDPIYYCIYIWSFSFYYVWPSVILLIIGVIFNGTEIVVTDKRVYGKSLFGRRVDLPIDSVSAVGSSWPQAISVSTSSGRITFAFIKNRDEILKCISDLLIKRQDKSSTSTIKEPVETEAGAIKKFKELLDMGAITQEEFDAKKKQLLGL